MDDPPREPEKGLIPRQADELAVADILEAFRAVLDRKAVSWTRATTLGRYGRTDMNGRHEIR